MKNAFWRRTVVPTGRAATTGSAVLGVVLASLLSCESAPTVASRPTGTRQSVLGAVRGGNVSIPEGAGSDLAKKQPVIVMDIQSVPGKGADQLHPSAIQVARAQVEAQLPRMKRFTVYSRYNDAGYRKAQEEGDTGIAKEVDESQLPAPDLFLNITATINVEENVDNTKGIVWTVCTANVAYTLTDSSRKVLTDTQYASGMIPTPPPAKGQSLEDMPNVRKTVRIYDPAARQWKIAGGFNLAKDEEGSSGLVKQTLADPLKGLVSKLALALPVTTQVTAINPSKTQFAVRAGQKNGIFKGTKVVVWCDQDDFSYAIADTVAEPTADKSNLKIVSWNDADPDAKEIIAKIKSGGIPDDLKDKIWATTEGIPLEEMLAP